jgi:ADP-heptose:LPS heptosyltransferase
MKILLLQLKRIGDLILTTPAIAALRKNYPDAYITLAVSNECSELLPAISNVDHVLIARRNLRDVAMVSSVTGKRFDYCIDFTRNDRSAFLTLVSGARRRVASYRVREQSKTRARLYTDLVGVRVRDMHTIDYNLALVEPLGVRGGSSAPQLDLPRTAREKADRLRRDWKITRPYVILHPGSARREKLWNAARWAEVIEHFGENNTAEIREPLWKDGSACPGGVNWPGAAARDSRFGPRALRGLHTHAAGDPVRADESVSLATDA